MNSVCRAGLCLLGLLPASDAAIGADTRIDERALSTYAGARLRLFDPFAAGVGTDFRRFLRAIPMSNRRPLPTALARETAAVFDFYRASMHAAEPAYFVATYIDKTMLAPLTARRRDALRQRYGEDLYPQVACPVFASHAGADVATMLSAASGLPAVYFDRAPGRRDDYHALFLLTEASHCGFVARASDWSRLKAAIRTTEDLRAVLEAIGDYEATAAFRSLQRPQTGADEADALLAARILAMFLKKRTSAYTTIPGMLQAYDESGVIGGSARLEEVRRSVRKVRGLFRELTDRTRQRGDDLPSPARLNTLAVQITAALDNGTLAGKCNKLELKLLRQFPRAVRLFHGHTAPVTRRRPSSSSFTLPGVPAPGATVRTAMIN